MISTGFPLLIAALALSAAEPAPVSRAIAGGGAALGAFVGGVAGASAALLADAALNGYNADAGKVPLFVLPPLLAASGAAAGGAAAGSAGAGWAAGLAGLLGAGAVSLGVGLVLFKPNRPLEPAQFVLEAVAPAGAAALSAGCAAAIFVEAQE